MMRLLLPLSGKRGGTSNLRGSPPRRMTVGAASCPRPRQAPPNRITAGVRRSLRQATHHGGTRQALHGGGRHFVLFFFFSYVYNISSPFFPRFFCSMFFFQTEVLLDFFWNLIQSFFFQNFFDLEFCSEKFFLPNLLLHFVFQIFYPEILFQIF